MRLPPLPAIDGVRIRHCPNRPRYAVGDDGSVWSCAALVYQKGSPGARSGVGQWHRVVAHPDGGGYLQVGIGKRKVKVAKLVLEAFHSIRPKGLQARHLDGDRLNNRADNLAWGTPKENAADSLANGSTRHGENCHAAKLTQRQVDRIRVLCATVPQREIADRYGVSVATISLITRGLTWARSHAEGTTRLRAKLTGQSHPRAKLSQRKVDEIRQLAGKCSYADLGRRFGVSAEMISLIVRRKAWVS